LYVSVTVSVWIFSGETPALAKAFKYDFSDAEKSPEEKECQREERQVSTIVFSPFLLIPSTA
jgi:hypothetical protein